MRICEIRYDMLSDGAGACEASTATYNVLILVVSIQQFTVGLVVRSGVLLLSTGTGARLLPVSDRAANGRRTGVHLPLVPGLL